MGKANFSDDFKRDAVAQITERGCPVAEVSERLGVSTYSLYQWKKKLGPRSANTCATGCRRPSSSNASTKWLPRVSRKLGAIHSGRNPGLTEPGTRPLSVETKDRILFAMRRANPFDDRYGPAR
jgi:transposase-like protein